MAFSSGLSLREGQSGYRSESVPGLTSGNMCGKLGYCPTVPVLIVLDHVLQGRRPINAPLELGGVQHADLVLQLLHIGHRRQFKLSVK